MYFKVFMTIDTQKYINVNTMKGTTISRMLNLYTSVFREDVLDVND